jgi:hypothetical protein
MTAASIRQCLARQPFEANLVRFVSLTCLACSGCVADALYGWKVSGTIVRSRDEQPIPAEPVTVELERAGGTLCKASSKTDAQGRFRAFCVTGTDCHFVIFPVPWPSGRKLGDPPDRVRVTVGDHGVTQGGTISLDQSHAVRIKRDLWLVPVEGHIDLGAMPLDDER